MAKTPQTTQKNTGPTSAPGVKEPATVAATDDGNAAGAQHLAGTSSPNDPEKEADQGAQANAKGEAIAKEPAAESPAMASLGTMEVEATARETLLGTIDQWGEAGAAEVRRVSNLLDEHDWSQEEVATLVAAMRRVAGAASDAARRLHEFGGLADILHAHSLTPADVLSFNEKTGIVVTRSGHKIGLS